MTLLPTEVTFGRICLDPIGRALTRRAVGTPSRFLNIREQLRQELRIAGREEESLSCVVAEVGDVCILTSGVPDPQSKSSTTLLLFAVFCDM